MISSVGGITKNGAGTMMLTAMNSFGGALTVNAGALYVGSTGGTALGGTVSVNNAGTVLGGTGTIGGSITVGSGAIFTVGNKALATPATGALATGTLTLATGSVFNVLLASGTNFSTLNATGTTDLLNASFTISLTPGAVAPNRRGRGPFFDPSILVGDDVSRGPRSPAVGAARYAGVSLKSEECAAGLGWSSDCTAGVYACRGSWYGDFLSPPRRRQAPVNKNTNN